MSRLPIDPDVTAAESASVARHAAAVLRHRWDILAVIALGGALGSAGRYGVAVLVPHERGAIPWSTAIVNIAGGAALGVLIVLLTELWAPSRHVRPFLGVGVLGGFTTFSTYLLDTHALLAAGQATRAGLYLFGTLGVGVVAVWLGILGGGVAVRAVRRRRPSQP